MLPCTWHALDQSEFLISYWILMRYNKKCYWTVNFILTDAKRRSVWIVYCSITLHVHRNISKQLFYYIQNISVEKSVIYAKFRLTFLHKPFDITTLRHRLCDISWSDVTIHPTLGRYVTNHATSSIIDLTWLGTGPKKWLLFIYHIIMCNRAARSCKSDLLSQFSSKKMLTCTFLMEMFLVGS